MATLAIWSGIGRRRDLAVFRGVATRATREDDSRVVEPVRSGVELADALADRRGTYDHLVIVGHGGPTWLLNPRRGVTSRRRAAARRGQVTVYDLAPLLDGVELVSLAACLCSASPRWWLRSAGRSAGRSLSRWGRAAYELGGEASFSARLRDASWWEHGRPLVVRGHSSAGHASGNPLLREHGGAAGTLGVPLYREVWPTRAPTRAVRRRWVEVVRGELAERWLMGDDSVADEIKARWQKS